MDSGAGLGCLSLVWFCCAGACCCCGWLPCWPLSASPADNKQLVPNKMAVSAPALTQVVNMAFICILLVNPLGLRRLEDGHSGVARVRFASPSKIFFCRTEIVFMAAPVASLWRT